MFSQSFRQEHLLAKKSVILGEYENMFKDQRQRLLTTRPDLARSQYGDVYATFEVSATYLSGLNDHRDQTATDALMLLNFYASTNFTNLPETTFEEAWRKSRKRSLVSYSRI